MTHFLSLQGLQSSPSMTLFYAPVPIIDQRLINMLFSVWVDGFHRLLPRPCKTAGDECTADLVQHFRSDEYGIEVGRITTRIPWVPYR